MIGIGWIALPARWIRTSWTLLLSNRINKSAGPRGFFE